MGEKTAIEWADASWNPWVGCHKVSEGCHNCYMFRTQTRWGNDPTVVRRTRDATFYAPLKWKEPRVIFVCSWSDFFIEEADEWRRDAWEIMREADWHTYLILTKRPWRLWDELPDVWVSGWKHVWLGVTAENQHRWDERVPMLFATPSQHRFVSIEPMLGPVRGFPHLIGECTSCGATGPAKGDWEEFSEWRWNGANWEHKCKGVHPQCGHFQAMGIDWVIVGGESGPNARPMELDWINALRQECQLSSTPFFFKQWGGNKKIEGAWGGCRIDGEIVREWPAALAPFTKAQSSGERDD